MSEQIGDPDCPRCGGQGFLYPERMLTLPGERGGRYCDCTLENLRLVNMERIWESLSQSPDIRGLRDQPPLKLFVDRDLWITSETAVFRSHLKAVVQNMETTWDARVVADSQLLDSWLGTAKAQGAKIFDVEVENAKVSHLSLPDLVEPPKLLILLLGVKQLANREAPNALLEALGLRRHLGRPTWLVDQPNNPVTYNAHRFYSETLEMWLQHWPHVALKGASVSAVRERKALENMLETPLKEPLPALDASRSGSSRKTKNLLDQVNVEPATKPSRTRGKRK